MEGYNMLRIGPANDERTRDLTHNGLKFRLKAHDPYGFIKVTCITTNENLEGQYTGFDEATKGAIIYANNYTPKRKKLDA